MTIPTLLPRVPRPQSQDNEDVLRRFIDLARAMLNPLVLDGTLFQDGSDSYGLTNLFYAGSGAPAATLGYVGDYYLDVGNPSVATLYRKDA